MRALIKISMICLGFCTAISSQAVTTTYTCGSGYSSQAVLINVGGAPSTAVHAARIGCMLYVTFSNPAIIPAQGGIFTLNMCVFDADPTKTPYDATVAPYFPGEGFDSRHAIQVVTNNPLSAEPELWITDKLNGKIKRINPNDGSLMMTYSTAGIPDGLTYSPFRGYKLTSSVFLTNNTTEITEFDLSNGTSVVLGTLPGFVDHMSWEAGPNSTRYIYAAQAGNVVKFDANLATFCTMASGLEADGVAYLWTCTGCIPGGPTIEPEVWVNSNPASRVWANPRLVDSPGSCLVGGLEGHRTEIAQG